MISDGVSIGSITVLTLGIREDRPEQTVQTESTGFATPLNKGKYGIPNLSIFTKISKDYEILSQREECGEGWGRGGEGSIEPFEPF